MLNFNLTLKNGYNDGNIYKDPPQEVAYITNSRYRLLNNFLRKREYSFSFCCAVVSSEISQSTAASENKSNTFRSIITNRLYQQIKYIFLLDFNLRLIFHTWLTRENSHIKQQKNRE